MNILNFVIYLGTLCYSSAQLDNLQENLIVNPKLEYRELQCLVCEKTLYELDREIQKIDPKLKAEIGGYSLDAQGNFKQKTVSQAKSESYLSEIADKVCTTIDEYIRVKRKTDGKLMLMKLVDDGVMNPDFSNVKIVQDEDLNKSLKYYCDGFIEEFEESIIKHYQDGDDNIPIRVCSLEAKYCDETLPEPEERVVDEL